MTDTSRRALWGVTAFYLAVTVVLAAPFSLHPGTRLLTNDSDAMLVRWILAWDVHAFTAQPWAIFDANTFAPLPNTLAYAENLIGGALFAAGCAEAPRYDGPRLYLAEERGPVAAVSAAASRATSERMVNPKRAGSLRTTRQLVLKSPHDEAKRSPMEGLETGAVIWAMGTSCLRVAERRPMSGIG